MAFVNHFILKEVSSLLICLSQVSGILPIMVVVEAVNGSLIHAFPLIHQIIEVSPLEFHQRPWRGRVGCFVPVTLGRISRNWNSIHVYLV